LVVGDGAQERAAGAQRARGSAGRFSITGCMNSSAKCSASAGAAAIAERKQPRASLERLIQALGALGDTGASVAKNSSLARELSSALRSAARSRRSVTTALRS